MLFVVASSPRAQDGIGPETILFSAAVSSCETSREWAQALELLGLMLRSRVERNVIICRAAISVCEKMAQWRAALDALHAMEGSELRPNLVSLSAAISACEKPVTWREAFGDSPGSPQTKRY